MPSLPVPESVPPKESRPGPRTPQSTLAGAQSGWTLAPEGSHDATDFLEDAIYPEIPGFRIHRELGRGAMGIVYDATQSTLNRPVAIKLMLDDSPDLLKRFQLEAHALGRLHHEGILEIYDVGTVRGQPFLVTELMNGGTLAKAITGLQVDFKEAASLALQMTRALAATHAVGILHRDLKPGNVLLVNPPPKPDANGHIRLVGVQVKLCDFGLAKDLNNPSENLTQTGAVMGTPGYLAPEQAKGKQSDLGPGTDIFSLGAILYESLTGRPPFRGETQLETIRITLDLDPVTPRKIRGGIPVDLETICLKCLQKQPSRRYLTALDLANDLEAFLANKPIKARRATSVERAWKWSVRNPGAATSIGFITAGLMIALILSYLIADTKLRRNNENLASLQEYLGVDLLKDNNSLGAMVWFAASLSRESRPENRSNDRLRMGALMDGLPWIRSYVLHDQAVTGAEWSPSGKFFLTFGEDRSIRVHDPATFPPTMATAHSTFLKEGIQPRIKSAKFLGDNHILMVGEATRLSLWDWRNKKEIELLGKDFTAFAIHSNRKTVALARGRKVFVDPTGTPGPLWTDDPNWPEAPQEVVELSFIGDDLVLRHQHSLSVVTYDPIKGSLAKIRPITGLDGPITRIASSPDGRRFAAGNKRGEIGLASLQNSKFQILPTVHKQNILSLAFSPDGKFLASGSADLRISLFELEMARLRFQIGHKSPVTSIAFSRDNRWLFTGSTDNEVNVWTTRTGAPGPIHVEANGPITFIRPHPTENMVLGGSQDNSCTLWEHSYRNRVEYNLYESLDQLVWGYANQLILRDGNRVRIGSTEAFSDPFNKATTRFVSMDPAAFQQSLRVLPVQAKTVTPMGKKGFAILAIDGSIGLWDLKGGKIADIVNHSSKSEDNSGDKITLTGSAEGDYLMVEKPSKFGYKTLALYHISDRNNASKISLPDSTFATTWAFSQKNGGIAWGSRKDLYIASLVSDKAMIQKKEDAHANIITSLAFSPDGQQLATGGSDMRIRLWNINQLDQPVWKDPQFPQHASTITAITFLEPAEPNLPLRILSGSSDNTLRIWHGKTGQETAPFMDHNDTIVSIHCRSFPNMGKEGMNIAASITEDGMVYLWDLNNGQILAPIYSTPSHDLLGFQFLPPDTNGRPLFLLAGSHGTFIGHRLMDPPAELTDKHLLEFAEYQAGKAIDPVNGTSLIPIPSGQMKSRMPDYMKTFSPLFPPLPPLFSSKPTPHGEVLNH